MNGDNNMNTNNTESTKREYIGQRNGHKLYVSHNGNVDCYTVEDNQGNMVDTFDKTKNEQLPARFIPER